MFPHALLYNSDTPALVDFFFFFLNPWVLLSCINFISLKCFPQLKGQRGNSFPQLDTDTFIQKHLDADQRTVTGECRHNKEIFQKVKDDIHSYAFWVKGYSTNSDSSTLQQSEVEWVADSGDTSSEGSFMEVLWFWSRTRHFFLTGVSWGFFLAESYGNMCITCHNTTFKKFSFTCIRTNN